MTPQLRPIPVEDRAWLLPALADALRGGAPVLPVAPGLSEEEVRSLQAAPLPAGTAVLVRTSGSSGVPKTVALSAAALLASAEATHEALGGAGQWLVTLPAHLISGLQMLVRSHVSGVEPVFYDGSFEPRSVLEAADRLAHTRRYISLVPVQLARLLDLAERDPAAAEVLQGFSGVLVGGQALSLSLRQRAHELGLALRRSYGMTETAGGCVYDGVETGDTRMRIRDGEVQLSGSCLALGYVDTGAPLAGRPAPAQLTSDRFVEDRGVRWYRTGDAGEMLGGMLSVTGRLDRVIVSGGTNVSLDEVERVVGELPGWSGAVALGTADPEWGQRVVLIVEAASEAGAGADAGAAVQGAASVRSLAQAQQTLKQQLGAAAVPVWAAETAQLPRLPNGKPDLRTIEEWAHGVGQSDPVKLSRIEA